jgi:hypothetical protein
MHRHRATPAEDGARYRTRTRREFLRGLLFSAVAAALAPVVAACRHPRAADGRGRRVTAFDETYRGRRIRGVEVTAAHPAGSRWEVTVDGRPLHLMRRADGTWLSMVDHYCSYPSPLAAARAAVDELGPGEHLRDLAPGPMDGGPMHRGGGEHGVHA